MRAGEEEWEEPLHPGPRKRRYPTFSHNAIPVQHFFPPRRSNVQILAQIPHRLGLAASRDGSVRRRPRRTTACNQASRTWSCRTAAFPSAECASLPGTIDRLHPAPVPRSISPVIRPLVRARRIPGLSPALLLLLLIALVASGCGGSSKASAGGDGGADPATVAPAGSALFISLNVRPQGETKTNIERLGKAILATDDLAAAVKRLLPKSTGRGNLNFERDVQPWLGEHLAAALPSFSGTAAGGRDALLIAASTDDGKARTALGRAVGRPQDATYRDVSYQRSADGKRATAIIDHLALFGTERAVKQAIEASKGTALSETDAYTRALAKLPPDAAATGYLDLRSVIAGAGQAAGQGAAGGLFSSVLGKNVGGVGIGAYADAEAIRLEFAVPGTGALGSSIAGGGAAAALAGAPADAWLGVGLNNVGRTLNGLLDGLSSGGGLGGIGVQALLAQAQQAVGLDIRRDLLAWMGSATLFVSGTSGKTVGGALVIASMDPAATRRAVAKLSQSLPALLSRTSVTPISGGGRTGFSFPISKKLTASVVAAGSKFVIAIGDGALKDALGGGARLGDAPAFKNAAAQLDGAKPVLYLDLHQVADLVSSLGGPGKNTQQAAAILRRFTQLVAGGKSEDGVSRATVVAGVNVK